MKLEIVPCRPISRALETGPTVVGERKIVLHAEAEPTEDGRRALVGFLRAAIEELERGGP